MSEVKNVNEPAAVSDADKGTSIADDLKKPAAIGAAIVALLAGLAIGHFAIPSGSSPSIGHATVAESELDRTIATFSSDVASGTVTIREAAIDSNSLESFKDEDGNYRLPSTEAVVSCARNKILVAAAKARGIDVEGDALLEYAHGLLGTDAGFDEIAAQYGVTVDEAKNQLHTSAVLDALRAEVLGEAASQAGLPAAPTPPADDNEESRTEKTKEYADYVIALLGDEWDSEKGGLKDPEGKFAAALKDFEVSADGMSYDAAEAAYAVAYDEFSAQSSALSSKWTDYVNSIMESGKIDTASLVSVPQ